MERERVKRALYDLDHARSMADLIVDGFREHLAAFRTAIQNAGEKLDYGEFDARNTFERSVDKAYTEGCQLLPALNKAADELRDLYRKLSQAVDNARSDAIVARMQAEDEEASARKNRVVENVEEEA